MQKQIEQVAEFHRAADLTIRDYLLIMTDEDIKLRMDLINEEIAELNKALLEQNIIDIADGIIDSLYVIIGTALSAGLGPYLGPLFDEVHRSNMTKLVGGCPKRDDGKVLKGDKYEPPDLAEVLLRELKRKWAE